MKTLSIEERKNLTSDKALEILLKGNERFINNRRTNKDHLKILSEFSEEQKPFAFILSCIDSRVPIEIIFDQGIGDLFSARVVGNIINEDIIASAEFAIKIVKVKLIMILGHTNCGAMSACINNMKEGYLKNLVEKIEPVYLNYQKEIDKSENPKNKLAEYNVLHVMESFLKSSSIIRKFIENKEIKIVAGMYDLKTGKVSVLKIIE